MKLLSAVALFAMSSGVASAATPAAPAAATSTTQAKTSGWKLECDPIKGALTCHAVDQVATNGGLIVAFTLAAQNDGKVVLTMNVPLGVSVRTPISLAVGNGPSQSFTYLACTQQGCFATGTMNADLLGAMKAGKGDLRVSYGYLDAGLGEHSVNATLSLNGFAEVTDKLK